MKGVKATKRIEIDLKDLFKNPMNLDLLLSQLESDELYQLIGASFIHLLRHYLNGADIEFNKTKEMKDVLTRIWKKVEKDLISSYNICRK